MLFFPLHYCYAAAIKLRAHPSWALPLYITHSGLPSWFSDRLRPPLPPSTMAPRALVCLIFLNLIMYIIVAVIAGWAINYGIDETPHAVSTLPLPARLFPIHFPIGNLATGFFVIFSLIAGVVGIATSFTGLIDVLQWSAASGFSAAASSLITLALTLLAMGLACKEISIESLRPASLITMETLSIILSGTQLLCTAAINTAAPTTLTPMRGRV